MNSPSMYSCFSQHIPARTKKLWTMDPKDRAGNTVGTKRLANRKGGGKKRGMKAGRQRQAKVNVANLVSKTNRKTA